MPVSLSRMVLRLMGAITNRHIRNRGDTPILKLMAVIPLAMTRSKAGKKKLWGSTQGIVIHFYQVCGEIIA